MIDPWVDHYCEDLERRGYSRRSIQTYRAALNHFLAFLHSQKIEHPQHIGKQTLITYQVHLHTGTNRRGRPWAIRSQWLMLVAVLGFLKFLLRRGQLLMNPADGMEIPRVGQRNPPRNIPTEEDVLELLEAPDPDTGLGIRDRAILEVLYATGMRISELTALRIPDVDLGEGQVHIARGKGGKGRTVPLGKPAIEAVHRYLVRVRPRHRHAWKSDVLFLSSRGRQIPRGAIGDRIRLYCQKAGIGHRVTPHSFRHACATHMLRRHASIRHIQVLLGHRRLTTTQIYTQVEIEDLKEVHARTHPRETGKAKGDPDKD